MTSPCAPMRRRTRRNPVGRTTARRIEDIRTGALSRRAGHHRGRGRLSCGHLDPDGSAEPGPHLTSWEVAIVIGEVFQWALLAALTLVVMELARQIAQLMPPHLKVPESGPAIGKRLPRGALERGKALGPESLEADLTLVFVSEACTGCQRLLGELPDRALDSNLLVVTKSASPQFTEAIGETGLPSISDERFWSACRVSATPLIVRLNAEGRVLSKEVTSDANAVVG